MPIHLQLIEKIIIKNLPEYGAYLSPYTFFTRFKITPVQLAYAVGSLERHELIKQHEGNIGITKKGIAWLANNRHSLRNSDTPLWKAIPSQFLRPQTMSGQPYIPLRDRLHKSLISEN